MHMMKTRATITIDPELHARARRLARARHTTVSGLFESFLKEQPDPGGSVVDKLIGSARLKEQASREDARRSALGRKYLKQ